MMQPPGLVLSRSSSFALRASSNSWYNVRHCCVTAPSLRRVAAQCAAEGAGDVTIDTSGAAGTQAPGEQTVVYKRRQRYNGKNPRAFEEKYKELNPSKYADDVAHVISRGATPAGSHRPIAVAEILAALRPQPGQAAVDCTLGFGGHAALLAAALAPGGRLYAFDADPIELPKAQLRLEAAAAAAGGCEVLCTRSNYAAACGVVLAHEPLGADCVLADLGVSSMQIDDPKRGFTFKKEGPLDLRMNPNKGVPAAEWLRRRCAAGPDRLIQDLIANADEPHAAAIAAAVAGPARAGTLGTTTALAAAVRGALGRVRPPLAKEEQDKSVARVFQAIRVEVNDEFGSLDALLARLPTGPFSPCPLSSSDPSCRPLRKPLAKPRPALAASVRARRLPRPPQAQLPAMLRPGGRAAILTFHSGEDRRVKGAFREGVRDGTYSWVSDIIRPGPDERRANPRSACAKLRVAVRAGGVQQEGEEGGQGGGQEDAEEE